MDFETVIYTTRGKVGYITMNRPEKRNALTTSSSTTSTPPSTSPKPTIPSTSSSSRQRPVLLLRLRPRRQLLHQRPARRRPLGPQELPPHPARQHRPPLPAHLELPQADHSPGPRPLPRRRLLPADALRHQRRRRRRPAGASGAALGRRQQHAPLADTDGRRRKPATCCTPAAASAAPRPSDGASSASPCRSPTWSRPSTA